MAILRSMALIVLGGLSACGMKFGSGGDGNPQEKAFAIDAVKLIAADVLRGDDEHTFSQMRYRITPASRLLLKYESLSEKKTVLDNKPLRLRIFGASAEDVAAIRATGKVCPITRPWMMAASWSTAHPWRGGAWTEGGSIDESECVSAEPAPASGSTDLCAESGAVCFDLTRWYKIWVLERPQAPENNGVALISTSSFTVYGDAAAAKSPRIQWFESGTTL